MCACVYMEQANFRTAATDQVKHGGERIKMELEQGPIND